MSIFDSAICDNAKNVIKYDPPTSKFIDLTGSAATITPSSPPAAAAALVSDSNGAAVIDTMTADIPMTNKNRSLWEKQAWTIEMVVLPINDGDIFVHTTTGDGLKWAAGVLTFSQVRTDKTYTLSYTPVLNQVFHVVIAYDMNTIIMYVNGVQRDIAILQIGTIVSSEDTMRLRGGKTIVDSLNIYSYPLSNNVVITHYNSLLEVNDTTWYNAIEYDLTDSYRDIEVTKTWSSDWSDGTATSVVTTDTGLQAVKDSSGLTVAGNMIVNLSRYESDQLAGFKAEWIATGPVTVEYTLDGVSWISVPNRTIVDTSTTSQVISFRISFAAGLSMAPAMQGFKVTGYNSRDIVNIVNGRVASIQPGTTTSTVRENPVLHKAGNGVVITNSNFVINDPAGADFTAIRAVEMWITQLTVQTQLRCIVDMRNTGATGLPYLNAALTTSTLNIPGSGTLYINGVATASGAYTLQVGVPVHIVLVSTIDDVSSLYIGRNYQSATTNFTGLQVEKLTVLANAPTASEVAQMYKSYLNNPVIPVLDTSVLIGTEPAQPFVMYAKAFSVNSV